MVDSMLDWPLSPLMEEVQLLGSDLVLTFKNKKPNVWTDGQRDNKSDGRHKLKVFTESRSTNLGF